MPRNELQGRRDPRRNADDEVEQKPEGIPSFLTARELQARTPAKGGERAAANGERGLPEVRSDNTRHKGRKSPRSP